MRLNAAIAIKAQGSSWAANGAPRGNWFKGRNGFSAAFRQDVLLKLDSLRLTTSLVGPNLSSNPSPQAFFPTSISGE